MKSYCPHQKRQRKIKQSILLLVTVMLASSIFVLTQPKAAQAALSDNTELYAPSLISDDAQSGLFTSITTAGSRLVAVGERGRIMLSDDSGKTWRQVATPTSVTLTSVLFITPEQGWVTGNMGVVLYTQDGGLTWKMQLNGIQAATLTLAQAQADAKSQGMNATTEANLQSAQLLVKSGPVVPLLTVAQISDHDVIVGGGFGLILVSHDKGQNWQSLYDQIPNTGGLNIYKIFSVANRTIFAGEQGFVASGEGQNFQVNNVNVSGSLFGGLETHSGALLLYGLQGEVLRSSDDGMSWQSVQSGVSDGIDCGTVLSDGTVLLGDVSGDLLASRDDGRTFIHLQRNEQPVVALAQAPGGKVIIGGPRGLQQITLQYSR